MDEVGVAIAHVDDEQGGGDPENVGNGFEEIPGPQIDLDGDKVFGGNCLFKFFITWIIQVLV